MIDGTDIWGLSDDKLAAFRNRPHRHRLPVREPADVSLVDKRRSNT